MSAGVALAVFLSALAGLAGAIQVAVMGELGERVGIAAALAFSGAVTLTLALVGLIAAERSFGGLAAVLREPAWLWTGGALSLLIILAMTVAGPRIGVTASIALVIAGNLVMAAVIDRYGLLGLEPIPLGWERLVGILLLAVGAALSLRR